MRETGREAREARIAARIVSCCGPLGIVFVSHSSESGATCARITERATFREVAAVDRNSANPSAVDFGSDKIAIADVSPFTIRAASALTNCSRVIEGTGAVVVVLIVVCFRIELRN